MFFVTSDAHLVALHRKTGAVLWDKQYADPKNGYYATVAPLAVKDRIVVGVAGGDSGMRGFVASLSAATGEELWRFYTIPAKGEPGSETLGRVRRRMGRRRHLAERNLRSRPEPALLDHRQSLAGFLRRRPARRQSLLLLDAGAGSATPES